MFDWGEYKFIYVSLLVFKQVNDYKIAKIQHFKKKSAILVFFFYYLKAFHIFYLTTKIH